MNAFTRISLAFGLLGLACKIIYSYWRTGRETQAKQYKPELCEVKSTAYIDYTRCPDPEEVCTHCEGTGWLAEGSFSINPELNVWVPCNHCNKDRLMPLER